MVSENRDPPRSSDAEPVINVLSQPEEDNDDIDSGIIEEREALLGCLLT